MSPVDFIKRYPTIELSQGEMLMTPDSEAHAIYAIRDGYVKVHSIDAKGNDRLLWIAGRYDIVPTELLFSTRSQPHFFYTALSRLSAYKVDKAEFLAYAQNEPRAMTEIARSMSLHYDDLLLRIQAIERSSIREKLIYTLIYLAQRFSAESSVSLADLGLHLTHQDIANLIGATRETTAVELKKMKNEGLIDYSRTYFTIHADKLNLLVD